jgi:ribose transport system substrate-binding protein
MQTMDLHQGDAGCHGVAPTTRRPRASRLPWSLLLVSSLAFGFLAGGCGPDPGSAGSGVVRIAVIPKGTTHDFWKSVHAGAIKAEREINAGRRAVEVIWKGPQKEDDRSQQIMVVQNFIASRVDGIVLAPLDDTALLAPVRAAMGAGIPVVIFDSGLKGEVGKDFVSYISTDNYKGGVLGARRLGEILGGKGRVILLRYQEGSDSTTLREKGFLETIAGDFPGITLISSDLYAGATVETGYQRSQNLLARFGQEVNGIFCPNESSTFGMLRALEEAGLAGKVKFVGFDSSESLVQAMREDKIHGLVLQNPIRMCYLAVKAMYDRIQGKEVEPVVDTGATMVTKDNMDEAEIRQLHSPDLAEWLGE